MPHEESSNYSESASSASGQLVRPKQVSDEDRRRVRAALRAGEWQFERRNGYVRPARHLPCGQDCVLADLGECGDRKCGNYRLGDKSALVRPDFLDFCVEQILQAFSRKELQAGIIFCSLGSGQLLFDWELMERLTEREGVHIRGMHLIDKDYGGPKQRSSAVRAQRLFTGWFQESAWDDRDGGLGPFPVRSFLSATEFQRWALRRGEEVHVLLDCDAVGARKHIDVVAFRKSVLRTGGLCLVLSNPAKRTAIVKRCRQDGSATLLELELQVYRRRAWRHLKSVSHSRTRSRQRSRSRRRKRRCRSASGTPSRKDAVRARLVSRKQVDRCCARCEG